MPSTRPKRKKPGQSEDDVNDAAAVKKVKKQDAKQAPPHTDVSADDATGEDENVTKFDIPFNDKLIVCERHGASDAPSLIFTHGSGGGIADASMRSFAIGFAAVSTMTCFQGSMNLANRVKCFHATVEHQSSGPVTALGGRSMGARAAVLAALEMERKPEALVLGSYPLMAGSKGEKREPERREKILTDLPRGVDVLFVIGSQDAQCDLEMLNELREKMNARSWLVEVKNADHGMRIKQKAGIESVRCRSGHVAAEWLQERSPERTYCAIEWDKDEKNPRSGGWLPGPPSLSDPPDPKKRRTA